MKKSSHENIYELNVQCLTVTTYTQYQNKLLDLLKAYFQEDIRAAIIEQQKEGRRNFFTPAEMAERVRHRSMPLCELERHKGHQGRAIQALEAMSQQYIYIPYYRNKKLRIVGYAQFPRLFKVDIRKQGRRNMVMLDFSIDVLYYYLNAEMGYHRINLAQKQAFRLNATRQMYHLYYAHFSFGAYSSMKACELGWLLSKKLRFKNCAEVIKTLLEPAREEMENAFYAGACDIHFCYKVAEAKGQLTPDGRNDKGGQTSDGKNGQDDGDQAADDRSVNNPIILSFFTRDDEHPTGERKRELDEYQARLRITLKHSLGVKEEIAHDISQRVEVWMRPTLDEFLAKKMWFVKMRREKKQPLDNEAGYIVRQLGKYFDEHLGHKRRMDERGKRNHPEGQEKGNHPGDQGEATLF